MAAPQPRKVTPKQAGGYKPEVSKGDLLDRFELADRSPRHRLIYLDEGEEGTGKTHFGLTMPGPILVQSLDTGGTEGLVQQPVFADKEIYVKEYPWSPGEGHLAMKTDDNQKVSKYLANQATELMRSLVEDFYYALENGIRSILWDKETDIWEMARFSEFGGPNDAPRNYPALNRFYKGLVLKPYGYGVNFGMIDGLKDEWVSKADGQGNVKPKNSGKRVRQGFDNLPNIVQIHFVRTSRPSVSGDEVEGGGFTVGKSRQNSSLQNQELPAMRFSDLAQLVFPDTTEEDWV